MGLVTDSAPGSASGLESDWTMATDLVLALDLEPVWAMVSLSAPGSARGPRPTSYRPAKSSTNYQFPPRPTA